MDNTEKEEINCSPNCSTPVISTFMIVGCEYFCMSCKWSGGIFSAKRIESTHDIQIEKQKQQALFYLAREGYIPPTAYRRDCDKCKDRRSYHISHVSDEDREKSRLSAEKLFGK